MEFFMTTAIRFHETGGPEVLRSESIELPPPEPGEARIRHHAIGLNFIDIYQRSGLYKVPLPAIAGNEGAGSVEAVGVDVDWLKPGDRVAYGGGPLGAYCTERNIPAARLCKLPDAIGFEQAAAMMLKGMTVQYLIRRTYAVQPGDTVLFHAAAGGVGLIACQWLNALGVRVIGTAGSDEKCALAVANGAEVCINYRTGNFVERVLELTGGQGVRVVYDSVGKDTFQGSLECLQPLGLMVSFGNASGPVPPFEIAQLSSKGSLFLTRPTLGSYTAHRADLEATANDLFDAVASGKVEIDIGHRYPLTQAAQAHRDMEARTTTGAGILLP
jgi:NADPH2:quinone reductase